jgi:helix-turn-helix protein
MFGFGGLKDGKHTLLIKTKYEGGTITTDDTLTFYVQVTGYKPSYSIKGDSSIVTDTGAVLSIISSAIGKAPITYQWLKGNVILSNRTSDTLSFVKFGMSDTGAYRCVAKNLYGSDTSRIFKISLSSKPVDTTRYQITIKTTQGGKINRSSTKS